MFDELTDLVLSMQEIQLADILQHVDNPVELISREYTGIDLETEIIIELIIKDISTTRSRSQHLLKTTFEFLRECPSAKKLTYLILENIIDLLTETKP